MVYILVYMAVRWLSWSQRMLTHEWAAVKKILDIADMTDHKLLQVWYHLFTDNSLKQLIHCQ